MEASTKKIVGTVAVAVAVGGGFYLYGRGKKILAGAKMQFALLGFRVHNVNFQEVEFAVKLRSYNPTKHPVTLAVNQVTANYNSSAIAFSTPDIKGLTIPAGSSQDTEILFQVPYLNLMGKGVTKALLYDTEKLKAGMTFTLTVTINGETITTTQPLSQEGGTAGLSLSNQQSQNTTIMNSIGQLGIVSGKRNTQDGREFNHLIQQSAHKDIYIKNGNVLETVESCINIIAEHHREVAPLATTLKADTLKDTCCNIFNFAYNYLQYHKDEEGTEQLRTPARSWYDGQIRYKQQGDHTAGIDCDDYSIFCGSLLKCLDIPFKIRITKYEGRNYFQHIYVFVPAHGDSDDEIIIDPVLSKFDYQKPYSFEKSDFNLTPLQMVSGITGVNGLNGTVGLGLPIYALSGIDSSNTTPTDNDHTELMAIVSGIDFENTINGLGNPENATLKYLIRTRDYLLKSKENKNRMAHIQNPDQFISMLNQAIKYWNTPQRDKVLDKLIAIEDKLAESGLIKYDIDAIDGFDEFDDTIEDVAGLAGRRERRAKRKRRRARFFSAVKRAGKKIGKAGKKVVKAVVRYNPLSIAIRNGLLAAFRLNMFGLSKKLQYAYLPDSVATKYNINLAKLRDLKKRHARVKKLFIGLQGKEANLKRAILKGAKQRSRDFSLHGSDKLTEQVKELATIGVLAELGDMGVVATTASVGAASGVLATIKKWLNPVKDIFNKVKDKAAYKKMQRLINKGKEVSPELKQRAEHYKQQIAQQQAQPQEPATANEPVPPLPEIPKLSNYNKSTPVTTPNITVPPPAPPARTPTSIIHKMSKGAKIGVGIGVVTILGTGAYLMFRHQSTHGKTGTKAKNKESLGSIVLQ